MRCCLLLPRSHLRKPKALGARLVPAGRKALTLAELLGRKQHEGEYVDDFVQTFEKLFEKSYGSHSGIDDGFKATLKRDLFVQGLLLRWQEKVLPTAETFSDALHQAHAAEEQHRQLAAMHKKNTCVPPRHANAEKKGVVCRRLERRRLLERPQGVGKTNHCSQGIDAFLVSWNGTHVMELPWN